MDKIILYICGTPGTGKTALSKYLEKYGFYIINLPKFLREKKLYHGYDAVRDSLIIDEKRLSEAILKEVKSLRHKYIAIEGTGAEILPPDLATYCIVLTCEPKELEKRLFAKGYPPHKIEENLEAERFSVVLGDAIEFFGEKVIVYDTSKAGLEEIARDILRRIDQII